MPTGDAKKCSHRRPLEQINILQTLSRSTFFNVNYSAVLHASRRTASFASLYSSVRANGIQFVAHQRTAEALSSYRRVNRQSRIEHSVQWHNSGTFVLLCSVMFGSDVGIIVSVFDVAKELTIGVLTRSRMDLQFTKLPYESQNPCTKLE